MIASIFAILLAIACARISWRMTDKPEWRDDGGWNGWNTPPTFDDEG